MQYKSTYFFRFFILASLSLLLVTVSCHNRKRISKDKLTDILMDINLVDGVRSTHPQTMIDLGNRDSLAYYKPVFEKYDVTTDDFLSTLNYYMTKPTELQKIYDTIYKQYDVMIKQYDSLAAQEYIQNNLWAWTDSVYFKSDSVHSPLPFMLPLKGKGAYNIRANYTIRYNDSTKNPRLVVWLASDEKPDTVVGKKEQKLSRDRSFFELTLYMSDTAMTQLRGYLYQYDTLKGTWMENIEIRDIYISFQQGSGIEPDKNDTLIQQFNAINPRYVKYNNLHDLSNRPDSLKALQHRRP